MADNLPPDHPQKRPKRKRPKAIRAKSPLPITVTVSEHEPNVTAGTAMPQMLHVTATPCHDPQYTGPERRGLDPFWQQLAIDIVLAKRAITRYARTTTANGIAWLAFRLMRLASKVAPNA
jgi:hypothetical protein